MYKENILLDLFDVYVYIYIYANVTYMHVFILGPYTHTVYIIYIPYSPHNSDPFYVDG